MEIRIPGKFDAGWVVMGWDGIFTPLEKLIRKLLKSKHSYNTAVNLKVMHFAVLSSNVEDCFQNISGPTCIVLGMPFEITNTDFENFLEPYSQTKQIVQCNLIRSNNCFCHALILFDSEV